MPSRRDRPAALPAPAPAAPPIPPDTRAIDIRDARALAAIGTPERCGIFEVLRCFRRPATLAELSAATRIPAARVAAMVDDLSGAGLVRTLPARAGRRQPSYEVTCQQFMIAFDTASRADAHAVRRHMDAATADLAKAVVDARATSVADAEGKVAHESRGKFRLRPDQFQELRRRLHAVDEFINQIATDDTVDDPVGPLLCDHVIEIRVTPLPKPLLPMPWILAADRRTAPALARAASESMATALSPRERQVALALAHGDSRPEIARRLGLSPHTVATVSKRIYAKLGVRRRAELANRLGALSRL
jgi:DNA-binding CsgD family transcriptional regulator